MSCVSSFWDHLVARYSTKRQVAQYRKYKCRIVDVLLNISPSSDRRKMKHSSLEFSHCNASNELCFVFLRSLDGELTFTVPQFTRTAVLSYKDQDWLRLDCVEPHRTINHPYSQQEPRGLSFKYQSELCLCATGKKKLIYYPIVQCSLY